MEVENLPVGLEVMPVCLMTMTVDVMEALAEHVAHQLCHGGMYGGQHGLSLRGGDALVGG